MSAPRVHGQPHSGDMAHLADEFGRLAASIEGRQSADAIIEIVRATQAACATASRTLSGDVGALLTNVQTALETWATVWPRLGSQPEFRQAVTREARLWANKLHALAVHD